MKKPIQLEDAPEELQKAIQAYLNFHYEVLQITVEEIDPNKFVYTSILTHNHYEFVQVTCRNRKISEQIFESWFIREVLELSETFRNRIRWRIENIEKEKEQGE
ncbi:hypothetical protein COJ86_00265 [Bacillus cereus]|nr:hypothetical protein MLA2C4_11595 [Bacillus mobilis]PFO76645.1 hypothetical protein COJ86_00265 [Bacillus cereus]